MSKVKGRLRAAVALACLLGGAAPAWADSTDDLLLKLKEKGILTEAEYQQLSARKQVEPVAQASAPATASPQGESAQQAAAGAFDMTKMVKMTDKGVGLQLGPVALTFSGSINGFYTHDDGAHANAGNTIAGGLASVGPKSSAIRNGLLPGFLKVEATTVQNGWNVGAHFGLYPGINSVTGVGGANSAGSPQALATAGIDFRQVYMTFGRDNLGEFKIGRDVGLFGSDAIFNDIALLSVGSTGGNAAPSNTSLGRIGLGYIYTDFQPQITYTSPKFAGFQVAVGAFQPLQTIGRSEVNKTPGFQGKLTYDWKGDTLAAHVWAGGIVQKHDATDLLGNYTGRGFDAGAKLTYGPASLLGYYYGGKGIGTTGLFILSTDSRGDPRRTNGFYAQGTYTLGKLTVGGSYGGSYVKLTGAEKADANAATPIGIYDPTLVDRNTSWIGQARYGLTEWVTLVGEYVHTKSVAHGGNEASSNTVATGAILFF